MNIFVITGNIVSVGERRNERAPWPCIVESDGGSKEAPMTRIPVDIFGDVEVGQHVEVSGVLDSREWNGRRYLQLVVKSRKFVQDTRPRKDINPRRYTEADQPPMPEIDGEFSEEDIPF